jgi:serine protease Do
MMKYWLLILISLFATQIQAEPDQELVYQLKASIVKVHVVTQSGGHGVGSGVAVGKDLVATNCHVLSNAAGVKITKFGDSFTPVALKADWEHDVCILRFQYLDMKPVVLGDSDSLQYEQEIFSIGFPGGRPKPLTTTGKIKGLYRLDDATIVRTSASFMMGASGSPVFDQAGKLIALNTFKSPGRGAYFYNVPVQWVKALMDAADVELNLLTAKALPFWDAPEASWPYFMRVVLPYQNQDWDALTHIASEWVKQSPDSVEAQYYLAMAFLGKGQMIDAQQALTKALTLQPQHPASLLALGLIAEKTGQTEELARIENVLASINTDLTEEFALMLKSEASQH